MSTPDPAVRAAFDTARAGYAIERDEKGAYLWKGIADSYEVFKEGWDAAMKCRDADLRAIAEVVAEAMRK